MIHKSTYELNITEVAEDFVECNERQSEFLVYFKYNKYRHVHTHVLAFT